jgi:beta-glucosidase
MGVVWLSKAFKVDMKLGVASAATQIEGGALDHSWMDWYKKGYIRDGASPSRANDHFNRWREDIGLMKQMGLECYRLGLEWARLEPREGHFDDEAFAYYRTLILELIAADIEPLLTLHHFTNPMWFENKGAFARAENIHVFLRFVREVVSRLGDIVSEYITINEPNVYAVNGYVFGEWPPGKKSIFLGLRVMRNMVRCHIAAYKLIHELRGGKSCTDTKVSFAHHVRVFDPKNPKNPLHKIFAYINEYNFQNRLWRGCGKFCDFIAINYYTRSTVVCKLGEVALQNVPKNDLGWEIYPHGIVRCAKVLYKSVKKPIYITENGTCDNADAFRARYIYDHIKELCESSLPVERYYHWCFTDNFEWLEGEAPRFGLVHIDYDTQKRTIKQSGAFYSEIIENGGITEEMYDKYIS